MGRGKVLVCGRLSMQMTHLRKHGAGQFLCFDAGMMVGQYFCRETADRRAGLFRRVVLRERRAGQFLFLMQGAWAPQNDCSQMGDAVRSFFRVRSIQPLLLFVCC